MTSLFLQKCVRFCTKYMTVGVIIAGLLGVVTPQLFAPLAPKIPWMLGIIMFGMGMSLTVGDFKLVFRYPKLIWLGSAFQFIIMPLAALLLVHIFPLRRKLPSVSFLSAVVRAVRLPMSSAISPKQTWLFLYP